MRARWFDKTSKQYLRYLSSTKWRALREQVIARCNNVCERCGMFSVAEVHHLTYVRVYHEELTDLQGLCEHCHAFLHGEQPLDGAAVRERQVKALEQRTAHARSELKRFEDHPNAYRSFVDNRFPSHRELIAILRQYPHVINALYACQIFDVVYARRKYESAVAFKIKWDAPNGRGWARVWSAEELLYSGKMVLDTERGVWVEIDNIRSFLTRCSRRSL
jgi:hypothetical protein